MPKTHAFEARPCRYLHALAKVVQAALIPERVRAHAQSPVRTENLDRLVHVPPKYLRHTSPLEHVHETGEEV